MGDFIGDRECVTHHHACDCREATFDLMTKELETAKGLNNLLLLDCDKVREICAELESNLALAVEALETARNNNIDLTAQMNKSCEEVCSDCDYECLTCHRNRDSLDSLNSHIKATLIKINQAEG